jgi:hypothetical protein
MVRAPSSTSAGAPEVGSLRRATGVVLRRAALGGRVGVCGTCDWCPASGPWSARALACAHGAPLSAPPISTIRSEAGSVCSIQLLGGRLALPKQADVRYFAAGAFASKGFPIRK